MLLFVCVLFLLVVVVVMSTSFMIVRIIFLRYFIVAGLCISNEVQWSAIIVCVWRPRMACFTVTLSLWMPGYFLLSS